MPTLEERQVRALEDIARSLEKMLPLLEQVANPVPPISGWLVPGNWDTSQ